VEVDEQKTTRKVMLRRIPRQDLKIRKEGRE